MQTKEFINKRIYKKQYTNFCAITKVAIGNFAGFVDKVRLIFDEVTVTGIPGAEVQRGEKNVRSERSEGLVWVEEDKGHKLYYYKNVE